ncbi:MAG: LTA synthase family protein [Xanthomonadales bacterium]|nr:LTA synthase family protein [Xanthomonadales bacterium]MDL1868254.1 LTA synthase family protein [Gammaproteobacteria bacterium PRO6]
MPTPPPPAKSWSHLRLALQALVVAAALIGCVWIMQASDPAWLAAAQAEPATSGMSWPSWPHNLMPFVLVLLLLLGLTARPMLAALLTLGLVALLYYANAIKLDQLGAPLLPADFALLGNLGKRGGVLLLRYLPRSHASIAFTLAIVTLLFTLLRRERPLPALRRWRRLALAGVAGLLGLSLYRGDPPWQHWYGASADLQVWAPMQHAAQQGLPAHLLLYQWATHTTSAPPDRGAAARLVAQHRALLQQAPAAATSAPPDIIVLQSESLFDPTRLRGMQHDASLPHLRELAATARHGQMWPPTFGGGTIRTEFEVLTGIAMRYYPQVQYPYFGMTATREQSIARVLRRHGYRSVVVHPYDRGFWNRAAALANLGFDEFDDDESFGNAARAGWYISDDALVDHVLQRLDRADGPLLLLAISMENHGPYADYPNVDAARRDAIAVPAQLDAHAAASLRGYLYHAGNADRALGKLVAALRQRGRRSLLLFYGDHLPSMPRVYDQLGFVDGRPASEQPVPWLLLDTADLRPQAPVATTAFYLPALLLDAAGIHDDAYFRLLEALRRGGVVEPGWAPADSDGLAAIMHLRQRREFDAFLRGQLAGTDAGSGSR